MVSWTARDPQKIGRGEIANEISVKWKPIQYEHIAGEISLAESLIQDPNKYIDQPEIEHRYPKSV